ncbi:tRNA-processing RNAse BN [Bibersteinia trehalosi]|uniref:virulence factor BrkB family protein n=1 Tax=Bibersteinia trehalosi TaxID=47735 RepID=UPI001044B842|nr:virulence factor BrkB family protein [Bibersteinia trehalosi]TCT14195.1 tRNA-processing RNAse BN [Bibersteinia trehalosi]
MKNWINFAKLFARRMQENRVGIYAGYLTYSTLLSIVPLIMVAFSVFALSPIFDDAASQLKEYVYDNFAPNAGAMVQTYLELFVSNSKKMGIVSILGLVVVAVMLISNIDKAFNEMWQNTPKRPPVRSFLVYLGILIFAPLMAGASIAVSTYLLSLQMFDLQGIEEIISLKIYLLKFVPFLLTWLMFTMIYKLVPNTTVKFKHAALGALFAGAFFTLGKQLFIWYITTFPSYQAIYGALATIPIMFVWVQLSWKVVLLGGQFASVLKEVEQNKIENGQG